MRNFITFILLFSSSFLIGQNIDFEKSVSHKERVEDHENDPRLFYYDVGFYLLDLNLTNTTVDIEGFTIIYLNLLAEYNNELVFDLKDNITVDSVKVNNNVCTFSHSEDLLVISYEHQADFNENYDVSAQIYYHGAPSDGLFHKLNTYGYELFQFVYSLSEPYSAKYWFPCKQVVSDKADSSYVYATIPSNLKLGSNGILKAEYDIGGGYKRVKWESSYPIAYYLISVAVSDYQDYSFSVDVPLFDTTITVQNYIPNNAQYLGQNSWYINRTGEMLIMLSEKLGLFPHAGEKYGHCITPLGGGMEHQTMTTLGNFEFRLVIHELTHSWFGDYVTCANWQDIWINEGFASYGEYLGEEFIQPEGNEVGWLMECQSLAKERLQGSVYVPFSYLNDVNRIFDQKLTYRKGACLVHMIRYLINNDDLFFSTLRDFLQIYGGGNATAEDLKQVLQNNTGISFDNFFDEWYYGEGYPIYQITWAQNAGVLNVNLTQTTTSTVTPLFTIPMEFKIVYQDNSTEIIRKEVTNNNMNYEIPVSDTVIDFIPNPDFEVLADISSIQNSELFTSNRNMCYIYPNPVSEVINFVFDNNKNKKIELLNNNGEIVKSFESSEYKISQNVQDLSAGIYILKIYTESKVITEKIVITKSL